MISSSRVLIFFAIFACICNVGNGKDVACYKLIESSNPEIKSGAIQFISFIGDQCYESNINGVSVNNGTMKRNAYQSNNEKSVYLGGCFCGDGAKFEFNSDKLSLIVTSKSGKKYKFSKIESPKGVTTCSIIRKRNYGGDSYNNNYYFDNNSNYNNVPPIQNNNSNNDSRNPRNTTTTQRRCVYCNGKGQITKDDFAPANFGIKSAKRQCQTCGKWYDPDVFTHYHQSCGHCGGTGISR